MAKHEANVRNHKTNNGLWNIIGMPLCELAAMLQRQEPGIRRHPSSFSAYLGLPVAVNRPTMRFVGWVTSAPTA